MGGVGAGKAMEDCLSALYLRPVGFAFPRKRTSSLRVRGVVELEALALKLSLVGLSSSAHSVGVGSEIMSSASVRGMSDAL